MKPVVSTLACDFLLPFAGGRLQVSAGARALGRGAVFRSCPPGRLSTQALLVSQFGPPPSLHSTRHPTPALWRRPCRLKAVEGNCVSPRRMPGDRRSEVKEEGRIASARSDWAVNRAGGHERSRSPGSLRAHRLAHAANSFRTAIKERRQRVALSMEGN